MDIGTGSYSTTNYPYTIYGNPAQSRQQTQEVVENGVGRVFYVTTDQNGIFRVGRFFTVDQGTGTVTFSASIALSNLDGLGFKRGVVVSEFSTDTTMTNNAPEIVPVQSAVRGYIDKRLGLDHGGGPVALNNLVGPGFLALNGTLSMKGNLNMASYAIGNVTTPGLTTTLPWTTDALNATNKAYVDQEISKRDQLSEMRDATFTSLTDGNIAVYDQAISIAITGASGNNGVATLTFALQGSAPFTVGTIIEVTGINPSGYNGYGVVTNCTTTTVSYVNSTTATYVSGGTAKCSRWKNIALPTDGGTNDVTITYNNSTGLINTVIPAGKIVNSMVNATAAIEQSKLSMTLASTRAAAPTGTSAQKQAASGLASFSNTQFSITDGFVTLQTSSSASTGVTLGKLQYISNGTLLGNRSGSASSPYEITPAQVVTDGDGVKHADILTTVATGAVIRTGTKAYDVVGITTTGAINSLVKTTANGDIASTGYISSGSYLDATQIKVDGKKIIDTNASNNVIFTTPGGFDFMLSVGTTGTNTTTSTYGTFDTSNGTLKATTLTTGGTSTSGTITGQWAVQASSQIDFSLGTLKSVNLTTGAEGTAGTITGSWSLSGASKLQATYAADLAEFYEGDAEYEVGTVLVFGGDKEVTTTNSINDTRVAGVVSDNAAYSMNGACPGLKNQIALAGRVPCKVVGRVKKGDMLTTSATPGYAVKASNPTLGAIIGKALEDKDYGEAGVIEVAVGRM